MKPLVRRKRAPVGILAEIKYDKEGNLILPDEDEELNQNDGELDYLLIVYGADPNIGDYDEAEAELEAREDYPSIAIHGRYSAADKILTIQSNVDKYGMVRMFRSVVFSTKTNFEGGISFYTFLRICILKGVPVAEDGQGEYFNLSGLNDFILTEFEEEANHIGIFDEEDLNEFFKADASNLPYMPDEDKLSAYQQRMAEWRKEWNN